MATTCCHNTCRWATNHISNTTMSTNQAPIKVDLEEDQSGGFQEIKTIYLALWVGESSILIYQCHSLGGKTSYLYHLNRSFLNNESRRLSFTLKYLVVPGQPDLVHYASWSSVQGKRAAIHILLEKAKECLNWCNPLDLRKLTNKAPNQPIPWAL